MEKLPYTKGTSLIKISGKQEKEDAEILPVEKLKGIFLRQKTIDPSVLAKEMKVITRDLRNPTKKEQELIFSSYISYYSFRKTFRTMLGLNNDLAEYYMGHKLGDNAKTTYIQINRLENKLFVEEYAEPVITMLDKFVFFSEEEMKKLDEENTKKSMAEYDFISTKLL